MNEIKEKYLDDAFLSGLHEVRIVHGKGTGALRSGIHSYLSRCRIVKNYYLAAHGEGDAGNVAAGNIESAENDRSEDRNVRTPDGENDQSDRQPADGVDHVLPVAVQVVHDKAETAETRDTAADAGGPVAIGGDVDTGGIRGGGIFADGAEMQTKSRFGQHEGGDDRDDDGEIDHNAVRQEDLTKPSEFIRERQGSGKELAGGTEGIALRFYLRDEVIGGADTERSERKTGHVLIGVQSHGQETVQKGREQRAEQAAQHGDDQDQCGIEVRNAHSLLVEEGAHDARDGADIHDTRSTEVQVTRLLSQDLTG